MPQEETSRAGARCTSFFFQAEDGIRDLTVTGVQTCALPIYGTYFERRAKRVLDGDFAPTFALELMRKDAGLALDLARAVKVQVPILGETNRTYDESVAAGCGAEGFSAVTHVIEQWIARKHSAK